MARAPVRPGTGVTVGGGTPRGRRGWISYFQGVWDELRKVIWPTRPELWRMTWVVVATVVVFAVLIGVADFGFTKLTSPLITTNPPTSAPSPVATPPIAAPTASSSAPTSPSATVSPAATATPSAAASPTATPSS